MCKSHDPRPVYEKMEKLLDSHMKLQESVIQLQSIAQAQQALIDELCKALRKQRERVDALVS